MPDRLQEKAVVGVVHGDRVHPGFDQSMFQLAQWDAYNAKRLIPNQSRLDHRGTNLPMQRNGIVRQFLELETKPDWLWFIDTDEVFTGDTLERLILSADPDERPIVSALIMAQTSNRSLPISPVPIVYDPDTQEFREYLFIPPVRHWRVAAAGTGALLIHRRVLEHMGEAGETDCPKCSFEASDDCELCAGQGRCRLPWADDPFVWFKYARHDRTLADGTTEHDIMGEDYTFSVRANYLGYPIYVDTTIEVGHIKERVIWSADFWNQLPVESRPRKAWAVIPTKGRLDLLTGVVSDLRRDGDLEGIIVCDNGSPKKLVNWCDSQPDVARLDCEGMGIHEMWNAAVDYTAMWPHTDLFFVNNDVRLGEGCVPALRAALAENLDLMVVCPNYDGRDMFDLERRSDICADRYDGTGGIAGFAFMARGELFAQGYRFPEECKWWFGDNDLLLAVNGNAAIVGGATCEHLDGGGKTGKWDTPEMQSQLAADKAAWVKRLEELGVKVDAA